MEQKYIPQPINTDNICLDKDINDLVEKMAKNVHEVWAKNRMEQGWMLGEERCDEKKTHPCLIPYEQLPEQEKQYDRNTAMNTLKLIKKLGFTIRKNENTEK